MKTRALAVALALSRAVPTAAAQEAAPREVHVNAVKDPEMKSYRAIVAGMDAFEKHHARAPAVPELKFRITSATGQPPVEGVALRLAGDDDSSWPVEFEPDGVFTLARNEAAYDANADLIFNQKRSSYKIAPEVRTPGLPDNMRRLGDLRLECQVTMAIIKKELPLWVVVMGITITRRTDWCNMFDAQKGNGLSGYRHSSPVPLAAATLTHAGRSANIKAGKSGYVVPLGDPSWPDDAMVELTPVIESVHESAPAVESRDANGNAVHAEGAGSGLR